MVGRERGRREEGGGQGRKEGVRVIGGRGRGRRAGKKG
jgi:hypothetical protein